jgi:Zn-dependent metalloprotease
VPDAKGGADLLAQKTGGAVSSDPVVASAAANGKRVLDYIQREFGRNSIDGKGAPLSLRVHAPDPETGDEQMNNAYWLDRE